MTQKRGGKPGRGRRGAPDIWYWESRGRWFVTLGGKQHNLGPEESAARLKFAALLIGEPTPEPVPPPADPKAMTAFELCDRFLLWSRSHKSLATFKWHKHFIESWNDRTATKIRADDIRPHHVQVWVDLNGWKDTTANRAIAVIQRVFSWGEQQGLIENNRLRRMVRPGMKRHELALTPEQIAALIAKAPSKSQKMAIRVLAATGMRPKEFRELQIRHLDRPNRRAVLQWSEAKGGRMRVIYFSAAAWELILQAAGERETGFVFLNRCNRKWTNHGLRSAFYRLGSLLSIPKLKPGTMRHSFATNALAAGVDALTVSLLMGHADPSMVARQYQHLTQRPDVLSAAIERADKSL